MAVQLTKPVIRKRANGSTFQENRWNVVCDVCEAESTKSGVSAGDAATNARREGFTLVNVGITRPMAWRCTPCSKKVLSRMLPPNVIRHND